MPDDRAATAIRHGVTLWLARSLEAGIVKGVLVAGIAEQRAHGNHPWRPALYRALAKPGRIKKPRRISELPPSCRHRPEEGVRLNIGSRAIKAKSKQSMAGYRRGGQLAAKCAREMATSCRPTWVVTRVKSPREISCALALSMVREWHCFSRETAASSRPRSYRLASGAKLRRVPALIAVRRNAARRRDIRHAGTHFSTASMPWATIVGPALRKIHLRLCA